MGVATATALVGVGLGAYQAVNSAKQAKKAERALNNFERQELDNAYEDIAIPTTGTEIMREEAQRNMAMGTDILRGAGARGILGGLPQLTAQNNQANRQTQAYVDGLIQRRDYAAADDQARIRQIQENRDINELAGIGQQMQTARQDMWGGMRGIGNSLIYGINNYKKEDEDQTGWGDLFGKESQNNLGGANINYNLGDTYKGGF